MVTATTSARCAASAHQRQVARRAGSPSSARAPALAGAPSASAPPPSTVRELGRGADDAASDRDAVDRADLLRLAPRRRRRRPLRPASTRSVLTVNECSSSGKAPLRTSAKKVSAAPRMHAVEVGVALDELGLEVGVQARAGRSRPAPGRRSARRRRCRWWGCAARAVISPRQLERDALEHQRVAAGLLERDARRRAAGCAVLLVAALHHVAAHLVHRLRGEAEVAHHRDAGADDARSIVSANSAPPSSFTLPTPPSATRRPALLHRLVDRGLVAHERQVADDVRPLRAAGDGAAVVDHLVHGDGQGRVVALDHHAQRVARPAARRRRRRRGCGRTWRRRR